MRDHLLHLHLPFAPPLLSLARPLRFPFGTEPRQRNRQWSLKCSSACLSFYLPWLLKLDSNPDLCGDRELHYMKSFCTWEAGRLVFSSVYKTQNTTGFCWSLSKSPPFSARGNWEEQWLKTMIEELADSACCLSSRFQLCFRMCLQHMKQSQPHNPGALSQAYWFSSRVGQLKSNKRNTTRAALFLRLRISSVFQDGTTVVY